MPFTYLGLPMGTTKPSIRDMSPLIDKVERRLSDVSSFLSYGDRLVLVNSVLSSLPTYYMLTLRLPPGIIDVLDRARRHCLWRRKDKHKVNSLAAWERVCKPKNGIINLQIQNTALLLKHLHKFYNNEDIPWVHLVRDAYYYQSVPHAAEEYRSITSVMIGNGSSAIFWSDLWKEEVLDAKFSRLFSFAKDKLQSVKEFVHKDSILDNFHLPLSVEAHAELSNLKDLLDDIQINDSLNDSWVFTLGVAGFKPSKVYKHAFNHLETNQPACWIWKSKCNSKHKFFAWLVL
jgi:hypothetical protein